jgi:hypothetical protein
VRNEDLTGARFLFGGEAEYKRILGILNEKRMKLLERQAEILLADAKLAED